MTWALFRHRQVWGTRQSDQQVERRLFGFFRLGMEGCYLPRGYGIAWREWQALRVWCCPIPFNLMVGGARWLWFKAKAGVRPSSIELLIRNEIVRQQLIWQEHKQGRSVERMLKDR